jgi:hypothetical protein
MKKKKQWRISCWVAIGMVISVLLAYVYGGEALPYVVFLCYIGAVCVMAMVYAAIHTGYDDKLEDVEALREKLTEKTKLVEDQAKSIKFLDGEYEAYRKDCDEAYRREALLKKQVRELRGRAEYWRTKYKSVAPEFVDAADEEIIITQNTDEQC